MTTEQNHPITPKNIEEQLHLLDSALGEIEVYRQHAMAGVASDNMTEVIRWLTGMEQECIGAKEIISHLFILCEGHL